MDENEGMSDLVVFQEPNIALKPKKVNELETLLPKEKIIDMEAIGFFTSFHHPAWWYGFFTGALLAALLTMSINFIYTYITK